MECHLQKLHEEIIFNSVHNATIGYTYIHWVIPRTNIVLVEWTSCPFFFVAREGHNKLKCRSVKKHIAGYDAPIHRHSPETMSIYFWESIGPNMVRCKRSANRWVALTEGGGSQAT